MLLKSWIQSLTNPFMRKQLSSLRRRRKDGRSKNAGRVAASEQLEDRCLLATGPTLISVTPNGGAFFQDGSPVDVRNEAPRELTVKFTPGSDIDPATLGGIELIGSGQDGQFETAWVTSDLGTDGAVELTFSAAIGGPSGNGIRVNFTASDHFDASGPNVNTFGRLISVDLNTNAANPTTAQQVVDVLNTDSGSSELLSVQITGGSAAIPGDTDLSVDAAGRSVTLDNANHASATTTYNNGTESVRIEYVSAVPGEIGSGIRVEVSASDHGNASGPTVTYANRTLTVDLNTNALNPSTAQQLINAINNNAQIQTIINAAVISGDPTTDLTTVANFQDVVLGGASDVVITPGYIGLGSESNLVTVRFAETLADDLYRMNFYGVGAAAAVTTDFGTSNAVTVTLTAKKAGRRGNRIGVLVNKVDLGTSGTPTVAVSGDLITVTLNTNSSNRSNGLDFLTAVNGNAAASQLVTATLVGDDTVDITTPTANGTSLLLIGGTGNQPIANTVGATTNGELFEDGLLDASIDFELDLGAQVLAVVPTPVTRLYDLAIDDYSLFQEADLITVTIREQTAILEIDTDGVVFGDNIPLDLSTAADNDSAATLVSAALATALPQLVSVPTANVIRLTHSTDSFEANVSFRLEDAGAASVASAGLNQATTQIVVHFNNDDLKDDATSAENLAFYQLIFTNDTVQNTDDVVLNPMTVDYDPVSDTAVLTFLNDLHTTPGRYRLKIGTDETVVNQVPSALTPSTDPGSSFDVAGHLPQDLMVLPAAGIIVSSSIDPQPYGIEFPGEISEPGHRDTPAEDHYGGSADSDDGVTESYFNFRTDYGVNPEGAQQFNAITEEQKERVREIYDLYGQYLGINFVETNNRGMTIVNGDLRVLSPSTLTGPGGTLGIASGGLTGMAIMDNAEPWTDDFGDIGGTSFFNVAMHEIGHLLGIGHSTELPSLTVNRGNTGNFLTLGTTLEPDFPGDHDIVHGQHLHRPEGRDVDLYRFEVPANQSGLFSAETLAERQLDASRLDTVLRLYKQLDADTYELIAQNDDYFSADSFISLNLSTGVYFIGVSSTGNDTYDPNIEETGFGGRTEGKYDLRLRFRPSVSSSILG